MPARIAAEAARSGNDACVPGRVTLSEAQASPSATASVSGQPRAMPTAKAPTNASPAPDESTAATTRAGSRVTVPSAPTSAAPLAPSVTMRRTARSAAKARSSSLPGSPIVPPSAANSDSLGMSQLVTASRSLEMAAAGAGLRIVIAPDDRAAANPATVTACGISN